MRAQVIGGIPGDLVALAHGPHAGPLPGPRAKATYAGALDQDRSTAGSRARTRRHTVEAPTRRAATIEIFAKAGSPVIAVNDGKVLKLGESKRLGRLRPSCRTSTATRTRTAACQDGRRDVPAPQAAEGRPETRSSGWLAEAPRTRRPKAPRPARTSRAEDQDESTAAARPASSRRTRTPEPRPPSAKVRLFANPTPQERPRQRRRRCRSHQRTGGTTAARPRPGARPRPQPQGLRHQAARQGRRAGPRRHRRSAASARVARRTAAPAASRSARPAAAPRASTRSRSSTAGSCSSRPRSTARKGKNALFGTDSASASIGQIMLMSKETLHPACSPTTGSRSTAAASQDIRAGAIDRRVLATLDVPRRTTASSPTDLLPPVRPRLHDRVRQRVRAHHRARAVDIAAINGTTIKPATQGKGSITDLTSSSAC